MIAPAQPQEWSAAPAIPWADGSGGVITLDEPLSIEELQTGALVLRMSRNGAPAVDVVGVPVFRGDELYQMDFYAYGSLVASTSSQGTQWEQGVFGITIIDRSNSWQVVGVRIDRQYWHGGQLMLEDTLTFQTRDGRYPQIGEAGIVRSTMIDGLQRDIALSVEGASPLGGVLTDSEFEITGDGSIATGISFTAAPFTLGWAVVKAVPMLVDGRVVLRLLYPGSWDVVLYESGGGFVTSLSQAGPYYLHEL